MIFSLEKLLVCVLVTFKLNHIVLHFVEKIPIRKCWRKDNEPPSNASTSKCSKKLRSVQFYSFRKGYQISMSASILIKRSQITSPVSYSAPVLLGFASEWREQFKIFRYECYTLDGVVCMLGKKLRLFIKSKLMPFCMYLA